MLLFYDMEVFKYDWTIVFMDENENTYYFHNNIAELKAFSKKITTLVGFNNHFYDDKILANLLLNEKFNSFELSKGMIEKGEKYYVELPFLTIDTYQEWQGGSLKKFMAHSGMDIRESDIDFNIDRPLTENELQLNYKYNLNDVIATKKLFEFRKDYFKTKVDIIKMFNLDPKFVTRTNGYIISQLFTPLKSENKLFKNMDVFKHLGVVYHTFKKYEYLTPFRVPNGLNDKGEVILKHHKLSFTHNNIEFGLGGIHYALPNYKGEIINIDVTSYYPNIIMNLGLLENTEKYKELYQQRLELKRAGNPLNNAIKLILNTTYGTLKSVYNSMYSPQIANTVAIYGQLCLYDLSLELEKIGCKIIQLNTDGIAIEKTDINYLNVVKKWENKYNFEMEINKAGKIIQRDVNNYAIIGGDRKGIFSSDYLKKQNNKLNQHCQIVKIALINYFEKNITVEDTIFNNTDPEAFQLIYVADKTAKCSNVKMVDEKTLKNYQKVCRVFPITENGVRLVKLMNDTNVNNFPNAPLNMLLANEEQEVLPNNLDYQYYIDLAKKEIESVLSNK